LRERSQRLCVERGGSLIRKLEISIKRRQGGEMSVVSKSPYCRKDDGRRGGGYARSMGVQNLIDFFARRSAYEYIAKGEKEIEGEGG